MHAGHEYYLEYETPNGTKGMYLLEKDPVARTLAAPETTAITSEAGTIKLQVVDRYNGTIIAKSSVLTMTVSASINTAEGDTDFEPNLFQQFLTEVEEYATSAETSATAATDAAEDAEEAKTRAQTAAQRAERAAAGAKSVTATVTQTLTGAVITVTDPDGTTEAVLSNGPKGDKGDTGEQGPKGDKGDTGATGEQGPKGDKGDKGDTGETGPAGPQG
ncbi:MAG: collagen-like protein, partial [Oscillospiraceae bacterium]|nr:collagen-like protein [Oscillospiraceae bacterium]